jgi:hypothetical protein
MAHSTPKRAPLAYFRGVCAVVSLCAVVPGCSLVRGPTPVAAAAGILLPGPDAPRPGSSQDALTCRPGQGQTGTFPAYRLAFRPYRIIVCCYPPYPGGSDTR